MESVIAALIGLLVCGGAVFGLVYTANKEYDCSYARSKDMWSLVGALLLGIFLLGVVMSGQYGSPGYVERMSQRPYKPYGYQPSH